MYAIRSYYANPVTVVPEARLDEVAAIMVDERLHTLPVVADGKVVGILGKSDVLRTLMAAKA